MSSKHIKRKYELMLIESESIIDITSENQLNMWIYESHKF